MSDIVLNSQHFDIFSEREEKAYTQSVSKQQTKKTTEISTG